MEEMKEICLRCDVEISEGCTLVVYDIPKRKYGASQFSLCKQCRKIVGMAMKEVFTDQKSNDLNMGSKEDGFIYLISLRGFLRS
jgi:predicted RNA-binding Zn-ribbon protein involved in translation (DUF1610 family)